MHWYGGSIAEAVTLLKQRNAIFVVFVDGENDLSAEMAATIDDAAVISRLSNEANFLAIKLKSGTPNYTHFAQIYQFVPVPSLFFIGRNGTPLEVVCAGVQASNLATRIDRILVEHHYEKPPPGQASTSTSSHDAQATMGLLQAEANASAPVDIPPAKPSPVPAEAPSPPKFPKNSEPTEKQEDNNYEVVCDGDVCVRRPKITDQPSTSQAPVLAPTAEVVAPSAEVVAPPANVVAPTSAVVAPVTVAPPVILPAATLGTTVIAPTATPSGSSVDKLEVKRPIGDKDKVKTDKETEKMAVGASPSGISAEEKLQRAKELLEATRREKAEKEKELERQKELERRNTGQGVAELKKWQADQEMKHLQEERKREKLENNLARQRILEQIAQDRAERKARDNPPAALPTPSPAHQQTTSRLPTSGDAVSSARVQFKLPDGTSHTAHFDADGTLAQVQRYVADNLQLSSSSYTLWTAFPRRELTAASGTLRELQLVPSAALLVLPRRTAAPAASAAPAPLATLLAFFSQLLTTYFYQPTLSLYSWFRARLFPPPALPPRPDSPTGAPPAAPRAAPLPRRRTNIHRIPGDAANDDDNNTWNGNSTQQM